MRTGRTEEEVALAALVASEAFGLGLGEQVAREEALLAEVFPASRMVSLPALVRRAFS